jgi:hypothetical protein
MVTKRRYSLAEDSLVKILADLELIVVSLDRIGTSTGDDTEGRMRAAEFLEDEGVFRRLAHARRVLSDVFDAGASSETVRKFEARLARLRYWKP